MAFTTSSSSLSATPNVTPLIDVLLVLLIIFMVIVPASPHGLESLIPAKPDQVKAQPVLVPLRLQVNVTAGGQQLTYLLNGERCSLEGLRTKLRRIAAESTLRPVFVEGSNQVDYGAVATVVAEVKRAGFNSTGLLSTSVH
jgi:biopolymer transport protein TolR